MCEKSYEPFCDFGNMPIANAFTSIEDPIDSYRFKMEVGFATIAKWCSWLSNPVVSKCFMRITPSFHQLRNIWLPILGALAKDSIEIYGLTKESFVVEIGCNDGVLIQNFAQEGIPVLGVEPSGNVAEVAKSKGLDVEVAFFDNELAKSIVERQGRANAIFSANVICHIPYIHSIFDGVETLLAEGGVFRFEDPYLGEIIQKSSFDQIYDEHVFFFSCLSVSNLAAMHNLEVIDVTPLKTHGGSMRYTLARIGERQVSNRVHALIETEKAMRGWILGKPTTSFRAKLKISAMIWSRCSRP